jgi:hypothetical protein
MIALASTSVGTLMDVMDLFAAMRTDISNLSSLRRWRSLSLKCVHVLKVRSWWPFEAGKEKIEGTAIELR